MAARILIVEDNAANLALSEYLLRASGHATVEATDGEEGLRKAGSESPDLILCDVQMPKLDGYELARRLKSTPALARIPVLAITAFAMVGDREKALAAGFDGYIEKPIDPETFVAQIEAFLAPELRATLRAAAPEAPVRAPEARLNHGPLIFVVDDVEANRDLARSLLEPLGYRVVATSQAHVALGLAREAAPALVLSDVCMSEGSGYDLLRAFKSDPQLAHVRFVFLTSTLTSEGERHKGLALGADRFLFRPIDSQELLAVIHACLDEPDRH